MIDHFDADHDGCPRASSEHLRLCRIGPIPSSVTVPFRPGGRGADAEREGNRIPPPVAGDPSGRPGEPGGTALERRVLPPDPDPQPPTITTPAATVTTSGQWWAHQLGLGYLYPRSRSAAPWRPSCGTITGNGWRFLPVAPAVCPRRGGGLLMCTWPHGAGPIPSSSMRMKSGLASSTPPRLMIYEGMLEPALQIVHTAAGGTTDGGGRPEFRSRGNLSTN